MQLIQFNSIQHGIYGQPLTRVIDKVCVANVIDNEFIQ